MTNSWIPYPAAVAWTVAFVLVALVHLAHVAMMGGRHRLWHTGHVMMAVGMVVMFWPAEPLLGIPGPAGVWAYAVAAGALTVGLAIARWRGVRIRWLWLASVADFAAMAYMFALMSGGLAWISVVAATWFAAQTLGWLSGWLTGVLDRGRLGDHGPAASAGADAAASDSAESPAGAAQPGSRTAGGVVTTSQRVATPRRRETGRNVADWSVRATLALMAAGMGYMMLAMQFGGMAAMSGGMGHM